MNKTQILKWGLSATLIISICVATYFVYQRFADENAAAKTELMSLIPDHCDAFLSIDKFDQLQTIEKNSMVQSYLQNKLNPSILKTLSKMQPYFDKEKWQNAKNNLHQLIISFHTWENTHAELLLFKMAAGDKEEISKLLEQFFKSSFTPLEESNAGILVKHYYVSTGVKFHCFYYKGIFAGSYNNRLIDETIVNLKNENKSNDAPDFMDIADESKKTSGLKFFIRLNGIPLHYGSNTDRTDTLNLTEWIAPELTFEQDKITMSCYTTPQFDKQNRLSLLIGQTAGRPLNPSVISKKCTFCIHYGLSDRERFNQNQQTIFGKPIVDSTLFRTDFLSIDSIFGKHFDSEINIAYYPVMVPEKQYQKVVIIRLKDQDEFTEKIAKLHVLLKSQNEENLLDKLASKAFPEAFITSIFGHLFELNDPTIYCDLFDNYLIVAARAETVTAYIKDLNSGENVSNMVWYHQISSEIDSKSNLYFIGKGDSFVEDQYILPFGMPRFLIDNQFLFAKNAFCFQFNAEESFIYSNGIIKQLKP